MIKAEIPVCQANSVIINRGEREAVPQTSVMMTVKSASPLTIDHCKNVQGYLLAGKKRPHPGRAGPN